MKELMESVFKFDVRRLLIEPSSNTAIQVFRALAVGGVAFIGDAGILFLISLTGLHYLICAVFGFIVGLAINFKLSIIFVFTNRARFDQGYNMGLHGICRAAFHGF